ncbi:hypothetical protein Saso_41230 [Streptomyces asoensis]|uniref:Uncharacterized protein n=1 Tax=Streptomyces asoensis TaxID=249586 RepID=A0ABQ3S2X1_9ACTN|nr:hypothetical protein Saso_41230 [Streptomyces asoensis]
MSRSIGAAQPGGRNSQSGRHGQGVGRPKRGRPGTTWAAGRPAERVDRVTGLRERPDPAKDRARKRVKRAGAGPVGRARSRVRRESR